MAVPEPVTLGELSRNIEKMELRINEKFRDVNHRLDTLQFVNQDIYRSEMAVVNRRLDSYDDDRKFTRRMLAGAFATGFAFPVVTSIVISLVVGQ